MPLSLRVAILCRFCGRRNPLSRLVTEPGTIHCVCTGCERSLQATIRDPGRGLTRSLTMSFRGN